MVLTFIQSLKNEKSFKGKIIAEIHQSRWFFVIFLSLKDGEQAGAELGQAQPKLEQKLRFWF